MMRRPPKMQIMPSSSSSCLPTILQSRKPLPVEAQHILHSLSTITSPSQLPPLLSRILHHNLHLSSPPLIPSSFILASLPSSPLLSLRLLSLLPLPTPLPPFNSLLPHLPPPLSYSLFLQLLHNSIPPDPFTYPPLLSSLSRSPLSSPAASLSLHSRILKSGLASDPYISTSLLRLYSAFRLLASARQLFDEMPRPNTVAYTTMMDAYNNAGMHRDSLVTFHRMMYAGVRPNRVTAVCALAACAASGALGVGDWICRELVARGGWRVDVVLGTVVVDMYAKCGRMEEGVRVFEGMEERNVYTWNALIGGFALAKRGNEAVEWFLRMEEEGIRPDEVTVIEVLSVCGHSGLVEMGRKVFDSVLNGRYGFRPKIKHYGCMVDLLGRAGLLGEAFELINKMPFEPGVVIWGGLFGGCRAHGDLRLSEIAAKKLVELEPENASYHNALSNLYIEMGRWQDAEEVRRVMKEKGMRKNAGWSFAEAED